MSVVVVPFGMRTGARAQEQNPPSGARPGQMLCVERCMSKEKDDKTKGENKKKKKRGGKEEDERKIPFRRHVRRKCWSKKKT